MHSRSPYDIKEVHVRAQNLSTNSLHKLILSENVFIFTIGEEKMYKTAQKSQYKFNFYPFSDPLALSDPL